MLHIVIGTRNKHKTKEIKSIFGRLPLRFLDLSKFCIPPIIEDGKSYRANALKKARQLAKATGQIVLAEDSGLEVEVLGGKPGIYSARYAGPQATAQANNRKLLKALRGVPFKKRQARYKCVAVLASPREVLAVTEGVCQGFIAQQLRGRKGFGYDPLFVLPRYGKTFGELSQAIKNQISHRAKALLKLKTRLLKMSNEPRYF